MHRMDNRYHTKIDQYNCWHDRVCLHASMSVIRAHESTIYELIWKQSLTVTGGRQKLDSDRWSAAACRLHMHAVAISPDRMMG